MSIILDALNRAERERGRLAEGGSRFVFTATEGGERKKRFWAVLLGALLVGAGAGVWSAQSAWKASVGRMAPMADGNSMVRVGRPLLDEPSKAAEREGSSGDVVATRPVLPAGGPGWSRPAVIEGKVPANPSPKARSKRVDALPAQLSGAFAEKKPTDEGRSATEGVLDSTASSPVMRRQSLRPGERFPEGKVAPSRKAPVLGEEFPAPMAGSSPGAINPRVLPPEAVAEARPEASPALSGSVREPLPGRDRSGTVSPSTRRGPNGPLLGADVAPASAGPTQDSPAPYRFPSTRAKSGVRPESLSLTADGPRPFQPEREQKEKVEKGTKESRGGRERGLASAVGAGTPSPSAPSGTEKPSSRAADGGPGSVIPRSVGRWLEQARVLEWTGEWGRARAAYRKALAEDPSSIEARMGLGAIAEQEGKMQAALSHYLKAVRVRPDDADLHRALGRVYGARGENILAISEYRMAIDRAPDDPRSEFALCLLYARMGRSNMALKYLEAAIGKDASLRDRARREEVLSELREEPGFRSLLGPRRQKGAP